MRRLETARVDIISGDTKVITFTIKDKDGAVVDITGATPIDFKVGKRPPGREKIYGRETVTAEFSKSLTNGITITDATNGVLTVTIAPTDTKDMAGDFIYEAQLTDASGNVGTFAQGQFRVQGDLIE